MGVSEFNIFFFLFSEWTFLKSHCSRTSFFLSLYLSLLRVLLRYYVSFQQQRASLTMSKSSGGRQHSSADMGSGAAYHSPSEEQETFESDSGQQERSKRKRKPASSPPPAGTGGNDAGGGRGGGMDALAVDFIRGVMRDTARRTDAMLELQGKVTSFKFEKRIAELEGVVAGLRRELSEKNSEIGRLTTEKQNVEAEADRQAAEHANQLALKDAELSRLRGEVEPERVGAAAAAEQRRIAAAAVEDPREAAEQREKIEALETKLREVELLKVVVYVCSSRWDLSRCLSDMCCFVKASNEEQLNAARLELLRVTGEPEASQGTVVSERESAALRVRELEAEIEARGQRIGVLEAEIEASGQRIRTLETESEARGQKVREFEAEREARRQAVRALQAGSGVNIQRLAEWSAKYGARRQGLGGGGGSQAGSAQSRQSGEAGSVAGAEQQPAVDGGEQIVQRGPEEGQAAVGTGQGGGGGVNAPLVSNGGAQGAVGGSALTACCWIIRYHGTGPLKCMSLQFLRATSCVEECFVMRGEEQGVYIAFVRFVDRFSAESVKAMLSGAAEVSTFEFMPLGGKTSRGHRYLQAIKAKLVSDPLSLSIDFAGVSVGVHPGRSSVDSTTGQQAGTQPRRSSAGRGGTGVNGRKTPRVDGR